MRPTARALSTRGGTPKAIGLLLACVAAAGLVLGTAGFAAVDADRGVEVNVTGDDDAYLGYEPTVNGIPEIPANESTPIVSYRNRFGVDLDSVTVDVSRANPGAAVAVESSDAPDRLGRGAAGPVHVTLSCSTERTVSLEFAATGTGPGVRVSLDRTLTVRCLPD
ncbi:hypothetical protein GCM10008995_07070 [Halobellus salinus]|uniref:DUF1102 domain-containing protein n=1 Tax=Halobellus salinus TaxID=931585 RepID=A0A830E7L6_9EURY|nr:hypothetical protein [Halobellus salinus]GGI99784.1 hypothetical protein GCM10008995_07070 [Halobellus salinus]SMP02477.1 hypothetical protein SAMN06265347_101202 [Halobellus salinus]